MRRRRLTPRRTRLLIVVLRHPRFAVCPLKPSNAHPRHCKRLVSNVTAEELKQKDPQKSEEGVEEKKGVAKSPQLEEAEKEEKEKPEPHHVMLSYAWKANKALVVVLAQALRQRGYDVWRDEDGSSILPPMTGDLLGRMAEVIQRSAMVVICVSPEYKESANCRAEVNYAKTRQISLGEEELEIVYVMVNEQYHTGSSPRTVDGWLGFMVGADLWYPLWQDNHVESTAAGLAQRIGSRAKIADNASLVNQPSVILRAIPSESQSKPTLVSSPSVDCSLLPPAQEVPGSQCLAIADERSGH